MCIEIGQHVKRRFRSISAGILIDPAADFVSFPVIDSMEIRILIPKIFREVSVRT
jgi:hypothetical protein